MFYLSFNLLNISFNTYFMVRVVGVEQTHRLLRSQQWGSLFLHFIQSLIIQCIGSTVYDGVVGRGGSEWCVRKIEKTGSDIRTKKIEHCSSIQS